MLLLGNVCRFSPGFFFFIFSFSLLQNFLSAPPTLTALRRVKLFRTLRRHKSHRRGQFVLFLKYLHNLANSSRAAKSTITQKRNFSTVREKLEARNVCSSRTKTLQSIINHNKAQSPNQDLNVLNVKEMRLSVRLETSPVTWWNQQQNPDEDWTRMNVINKRANWKQSDQLLLLSQVGSNNFLICRHEYQNHRDTIRMMKHLSFLRFLFCYFCAAFLHIWIQRSDYFIDLRSLN